MSLACMCLMKTVPWTHSHFNLTMRQWLFAPNCPLRIRLGFRASEPAESWPPAFFQTPSSRPGSEGYSFPGGQAQLIPWNCPERKESLLICQHPQAFAATACWKGKVKQMVSVYGLVSHLGPQHRPTRCWWELGTERGGEREGRGGDGAMDREGK
jgi:hypothetical protein